MATLITSEVPRPVHLFVTHVEGEGKFLKISGQADKQCLFIIENMFETAKDDLQKGVGTVLPAAIHEGVIYVTKYRDGMFYRVKVISTSNIAKGLVEVHFIDFGNKDMVFAYTLICLDNYDPKFLQLCGQATDYYLSRAMNPSGEWKDSVLNKIHSWLCYSEINATLDVQLPNASLISIPFKNKDFSTHLVSAGFCTAIPLAEQEALLMQMANESIQTSN